MRRRRWTDEDLIAAVAGATSLSEVLDRLGLARGGASLTAVRRRILELGLDTSHFGRPAKDVGRSNDPSPTFSRPRA